jgi:hypothetical protein
MKKVTLIAALAVLGLVILVKAGIFDSLMLFLLAGVIPGTTYAIPSTFMLLLITSIAWLLVFNLVSFETPTAKKTSKKKATATKKHLPKQRYKEV